MKSIFESKAFIWLIFLPILFLSFGVISCNRSTDDYKIFSFDVTCDMRKFAGTDYQTSQYFMGVCEAIRKIGKGSFMVSPGDIDPPWQVSETINKILGEDYYWYPVVGNHESETPEDMEWLRNWGKKDIPNLVRKGPENCEETTYSFEYKNAHFAVINQYFDGVSDIGTNGDVSDSLYIWLKNDLENTSKPFVFVFGHEPIVSIPDVDNGRHRHKGDNLDEHTNHNHRFQVLLRKHNVTAYICGHTHNFSSAKINGIWQIDAGHSRGIGDKGARSTFLKINVGRKQCSVDVYRCDSNCENYSLTRTILLKRAYKCHIKIRWR